MSTRSSGSDDKPIDFTAWDCWCLGNSLATCTQPSPKYFDSADRLEIGLLISLLSSVGFLSSGVKYAFFSDFGTWPFFTDALHNEEMNEEMISAHSLSYIGRGSTDDCFEGAPRMILITPLTTMSAKSMTGGGANVGNVVSSVLTRMSATLHLKKHIKSSVVKQELVEDLDSGVPQQIVNVWPKLAWSFSFFAYLRSPKLLALDAKSMLHVADRQAALPPGRHVARVAEYAA